MSVLCFVFLYEPQLALPGAYVFLPYTLAHFFPGHIHFFLRCIPQLTPVWGICAFLSKYTDRIRLLFGILLSFYYLYPKSHIPVGISPIFLTYTPAVTFSSVFFFFSLHIPQLALPGVYTFFLLPYTPAAARV